MGFIKIFNLQIIEIDNMSDHYCSKVEKFHVAFDAYRQHKPGMPEEDPMLRVRLLQEELDELKEAIEEEDLVEVLDALGDLQYILSGTVVTFGMQDIFQQAFDEIHSSNMSKLDDDGKPILREDGKILKSDNFREPQLGQFLDEYAKLDTFLINPNEEKSMSNEEEKKEYVMISKSGKKVNRLQMTPTEAEQREQMMRKRYGGAITYRPAEEVDKETTEQVNKK